MIDKPTNENGTPPPLDSLLSVPLEDMAHRDHMRLLQALVHKAVARHIDLPGGKVGLILSEDDVKPISTCTAQVRSFQPLEVESLLVLETAYEQIDEERRTVSTSWGTNERSETTEKRTPRLVLVPPGAWDLVALYLGNQNAFPAQAGPARCLATPVTFPPTFLPAGVDAICVVKHRLAGPVCFRALLIGRPVAAEPLPVSDALCGSDAP